MGVPSSIDDTPASRLARGGRGISIRPEIPGPTCGNRPVANRLRFFEAASPLTYVSTDDPPVILFYREPNAPRPAGAKPREGTHHHPLGEARKSKLDPLHVECILRHTGLSSKMIATRRVPRDVGILQVGRSEIGARSRSAVGPSPGPGITASRDTRRRISAGKSPPSCCVRARDRSIKAMKSGFVPVATVSRSVLVRARMTAVGNPWSVMTSGSDLTP